MNAQASKALSLSSVGRSVGRSRMSRARRIGGRRTVVSERKGEREELGDERKRETENRMYAELRRAAPLLDRAFDLFHWRAPSLDREPRATREAFQSRVVGSARLG